MPDLIAGDIKPLVVEGVRRGKYGLLLGAGFSASSTSKSDRRLPTSPELAAELAKHFDLPAHYDLQRLTGAIEEDALRDYLVERFLGCAASAGARRVGSFLWRIIYTLNVDDVLRDCFEQSSSLQVPQFLTYREPYQQPEGPSDVQVIHLHGSVMKPGEGFVFSIRQYAETIVASPTWHQICVDDLMTAPIIVVGCSLEEADLETVLARRPPRAQPGSSPFPSLFVTRSVDPVVEATCRRFGLTPVQSEADPFWDYLSTAIPDRQSAAQINSPPHETVLFKVSPDQRTLATFYSQWRLCDPQAVETPISPLPLLRGAEPTLWHIAGNQDIPRSSVLRWLSEILDWKAKERPGYAFHLVLGANGDGKSVALLRFGLELARAGVLAFIFQGRSRLHDDVLVDVAKKLAVPAVFLVDNVAAHVDQLAATCNRIQGTGRAVCFIGAERRTHRRKLDDHLPLALVREKALAPLSEDEAIVLVQKCRAQGLLRGKARMTDKDLAGLIQGKPFLEAVIEAGAPTETISRVLRREYEEIQKEVRPLYTAVCIAHAAGQSVRISIVQRATGLATKTLWHNMGTLEGLVARVGLEGEYLQARHRVIAEYVVQDCMAASERYDQIRALVLALSGYVTRQAIMRGLPEARLAAKVMDYDGFIEKFLGGRAGEWYESIADTWKWNSRYWEQRALLTMKTDIDRATEYAEQAVAIEKRKHPYALTTLAKIKFEKACRVLPGNGAWDIFEQAMQVAEQAIERGHWLRRPEVHPYDVAVRSSARFVAKARRHGKRVAVDKALAERIASYIDEVRRIGSSGQARALENVWWKARTSGSRGA